MTKLLNIRLEPLLFLVCTPLTALSLKAEHLEGKIKEVSGGPGGQTQVQLKTDANTINLKGHTSALTQELKRLNKMNVRLVGHTKGSHFEVISYTLLKHKSGKVPTIGHFAELEINGQYRIIFVYPGGKSAILPIGWAKKMRRHVGAKAWMIGEPRDGQLTPRRFGILTPVEQDD